MSRYLDILVGKVITDIKLYDNKDGVTISGDGFYYRFDAEAECCSQSWIECIEDAENIIGYPVLKVEVKKSEKFEYEKDAGDYDVLECIAYEIYTEKGICRIEFRNDSNGYYSGWLALDKINSSDEEWDKEAGRQ